MLFQIKKNTDTETILHKTDTQYTNMHTIYDNNTTKRGMH